MVVMPADSGPVGSLWRGSLAGDHELMGIVGQTIKGGRREERTVKEVRPLGKAPV